MVSSMNSYKQFYSEQFSFSLFMGKCLYEIKSQNSSTWAKVYVYLCLIQQNSVACVCPCTQVFVLLVLHITSRDKCKIPGEEERWQKGIWEVACVGRRSRKDASFFSPYSGSIFVLMTPKHVLLGIHITVSAVISTEICDQLCFQFQDPRYLVTFRYPMPSQLNTSKCIPKPVHPLRFAPVLSTSFLSREFSLHCVFNPLSQLHCHCPSAQFLSWQPATLPSQIFQVLLPGKIFQSVS